MKYVIRALAVSALLVLGLGLLAESRAEVSVRTGRTGDYLRTQVIPAGPQWDPKIWSVRSRGVRFRALNPRGDRYGDLWPVVVESTRAPYHPWAVWSRSTGHDYQLVWSRWTDRGWSDIDRVAPVPGSELDPDLAFDSRGRPYLVWWARDEEGRGAVYLSVFALGSWMEPYLVSRRTVDARYPSVEIEEGGQVRVDFLTALGTISHYFSMTLPVTITDDIDPQIQSNGLVFKAYKP